MKLKILLPTRVLVDEPAAKVVAEAENGAFCLKPRHADMVAALMPSILAYTDESGHERFAAVDEGVLVKAGDEVLVSVRNGVAGAPLGELEETVRERFSVLSEQEKKARSSLARLEAGFARKFLEVSRGAG